MRMRRLAGLRLTLNLFILAASLSLIIGALWAAVFGLPAGDSGLARFYAPAVRAWAAYAQFGMPGKLAVLLAAAAALALLLFVFLFTFRWRIEEWSIVAISGPVYLLVALVVVLASNLLISMIRLLVLSRS